MVFNSLLNFLSKTNKVDHTRPWANIRLQTLTKFTTYNKHAILIVKTLCTFHEGTKLKTKMKRGTKTFSGGMTWSGYDLSQGTMSIRYIRLGYEAVLARESPLRDCG